MYVILFYNPDQKLTLILQYNIRISKPDGTHTTIFAPFTHPANELQMIISKKPGFVTTQAPYRLFLRERGYGQYTSVKPESGASAYSSNQSYIERLVGAFERPIKLQLLRLEQAGYTEWDRPEELGREDQSYLLKFIFKAETAPLKSTVSVLTFLL